MNEKKSTLTPHKDILSALFNDSKLSFNPGDARIWQVWDEVVGPPIARNAQPLWIRKGTLRVKVSHQICLQRVSLAGEMIRDKLNVTLGRKAVDKIEFRLLSR